MAGEQQFKVFLSFKDEATGKFIKATEDQIASVKKLGITVKKEGAGVGLDLDKMAKGHETAGRSARFHTRTITELQGSIGSLRNILLLYFFAMRPIMKLYKSTTEAAIGQENAERKLGAAFAATGRGSQAGTKAIIDYATELQNLTGYADDQIISSAALLANYKLTEDQVKKVIPVMLDMTSALKAGGSSSVDLEAIGKRLGLAFTGQASYLKRYGIVIDETTAKYGTFDEILKAVESSVSGIAVAMAQTFEGQRTIFRAAISDYHEQLGMIITKSTIVIAAMRLMGESIKNATERIKESRTETDNFISSWERIAAAIIGVAGSIQYLWRAFYQGLRAITIMLAKLIEFFKIIHIKIAETAKKLAELTPLTKNLADYYQKEIDRVKEQRDVAKFTAEGIVADFKKAAKDMEFPIGKMTDIYGKLIATAASVAEEQKATIKGLKEELEGVAESLGNTFSASLTFMTAAVTGMRDAFVNGFIKVIKSDMEGLKDIVVSFGDMMLKTILQIAINMAMIKIGLGAFLGFPGGLGAHTGGYMLSLENSFGYRKKFHSGGEVPATLLEGEGIVNRTGMRSLGVDNLNKLNRGEPMGAGQIINNYYIQTIDERSFRERLQEHGDIYTGASQRGISDNMSLRKISQRWG